MLSHLKMKIKRKGLGTSLEVQWLRRQATSAGGLGLISGWGARYYKLQLRVHMQQLKIPHATMKMSHATSKTLTVKQIIREPIGICCVTQGLCNNLEVWEGVGGSRDIQEGVYICLCLWLICVDIWQKPMQYYKAVILQFKISIFFKKKWFGSMSISRNSTYPRYPIHWLEARCPLTWFHNRDWGDSFMSHKQWPCCSWRWRFKRQRNKKKAP